MLNFDDQGGHLMREGKSRPYSPQLTAFSTRHLRHLRWGQLPLAGPRQKKGAEWTLVGPTAVFP
jgi:hypothetical protein